jgi:hypothetical protein
MRVAAADSSWSPDGSRIAVYVIPNRGAANFLAEAEDQNGPIAVVELAPEE